jgi:hypothetical protein
MTIRSFVVLVAAPLVAGCANTPIQHRGMHLHADVGVVGSGSSTTYEGDSMKMSGTGVGFSLAMGGAVAPNLILGGDLWLNTAMDPRLTVNGVSGTATDMQYNVVGIGPRLTYYLPYNIYVSATPSLTRLTFADDESSGSTQLGFGLRTSLGVEWSTGGNWGVGVAGVFHLASNKDRDDGFGNPPTWKTRGGGVVVSFSMN